MNRISAHLQQWRATRQARRITLDQARARAARGAAYLDSVDPGWFTRLDPTVLALENGHSCVLGQLHGEFRLGLGRADVLHMSSAPRANISPVSLGFLSERGLPAALEALDYQHLDQAWQEEIDHRQPVRPLKREARQPAASSSEHAEKMFELV